MLTAGWAIAGFDNSHHDLRKFASLKDGCFQCHGRVSTARPASPATDNVGQIGGFCLVTCHQGAGGILPGSPAVVPGPPPSVDLSGAYTAAPTTSPDIVYFGNAHKQIWANLLQGGANPATAEARSASTDSWPYITNARLECTTCHSVHDNQNSPFLWASIGAGATSFCDRCHTWRSTTTDLSVDPPAGASQHPVNFAFDNDAAATRTTGTRLPRRINLETYGATSNRIFDVASVNGTDVSTGLGNPALHYTLGGKLSSFANYDYATRTAKMGCYTCHAVHQDGSYGRGQLLVIAGRAGGSVNGSHNPICLGCHGQANGWGEATAGADILVGMTAYGHPTGYLSNNNGTAGQYTSSIGGYTFTVNVATPPASGKQGIVMWGDNGRVLCTTCHQVHSGVAGTMAIANLGQTFTGTTIVCKQCHNGVGFQWTHDTTTANKHHKTNTVVANPQTAANRGTNYTTDLYVENPSWANATTGVGIIVGQNLDCADCHVFNGTAHNW